MNAEPPPPPAAPESPRPNRLWVEVLVLVGLIAVGYVVISRLVM